MKKVLVWDLYYVLKNSGGPAGYLYNIREYLSKNPSQKVEIHFLKDLIGIPNVNNSMNSKHKKLMKFIYFVDFLSIIGYYRLIRTWKFWNIKTKNSEIRGLNLNDFDVIHFHNSSDLYKAYDVLKSYNGKIILTSHSPQPSSYEAVSHIKFKRSFVKTIFREILFKKELKAWNYANYIMFPVDAAIEPYYVENRIKEFKDTYPNKFIYCESAILEKPISNPIPRKELGVDDSKVMVCYIGRHNEIKGYDQLKLFAERILAKNKNIVFVIAGNEEPLKRLNHPNWIELGWINYSHRLISTSDIFILPNKETYFDLVTLEVMREGTPILMTKTGGNKYFSNYGDDFGFYLYNYGDIEEQENKFYKMVEELLHENLNRKSIRIRKLFEDKFTIEHYINRYSELICSICI